MSGPHNYNGATLTAGETGQASFAYGILDSIKKRMFLMAVHSVTVDEFTRLRCWKSDVGSKSPLDLGFGSHR